MNRALSIALSIHRFLAMKTHLFGLVFASTLASIAFSPTLAQAATRNLSCNTSIGLNNGVTLNYKITGSIELDRAGQQVIPNERSSKLSMTVQRRDRFGKVQTLLNKTPLNYFEQVGPDADYSLVPFSATFRGKPNNGRGIYKIQGSSHGLYTSLRPNTSLPQQFQVVHYLSPNQWVRSSISQCRALN